jgi:UTP--glucose-1-phosphate uridylyltransferase
MSKPIKRAIFPVAGLGTRFLPATKAIPKEMLPVVDKPILQYAVEAARAAGIEEFIFVTSKGKTALEDHFDRNVELEWTLESRGKTDFLDVVRDAVIPSGDVVFTRQHEPLGLGHAIWCARKHIGNEPFAVILPDELVLSKEPVLKQMVEGYESGAVLGVADISREETHKYGILDVESDDGKYVIAKGLVEKPAPADAPSTVSITGPYILPAEIMDFLSEKKHGSGGEIQLTDSIARLIGQQPVKGFRYEGVRYDCGSMGGFVRANIAFAMERPELRDELESFIAQQLNSIQKRKAS